MLALVRITSWLPEEVQGQYFRHARRIGIRNDTIGQVVRWKTVLRRRSIAPSIIWCVYRLRSSLHGWREENTRSFRSCG